MLAALITVYPDLLKKANFFAGLKLGGHRGSPYEAPENTLEGFAMAKLSKCDMVEFDIHLSSDGVPVLMHDESTGRMSSKDVVINNTKAADLKKIPLKLVNGVKGAIPTLAEAVDWCVENNMKMVFDVKCADAKMIASICDVIRNKNLYAKAIVSSFNASVAFMIKRYDSNILTGFTSRSSYMTFEDSDKKFPREYPPMFYCNLIIDDLIDLGVRTFILPAFLGVDMLLLHYKLINGYLVEEARERNIHVMAWTVNDPYHATCLRLMNVSYLTDYPQLLKEKQ